jgi:spore germination protein YaaH
MLASPRRRAAVVSALVGIARQPGYAGIDLDFEQFAVDPEDDLAAADAAAAGYPVLVAELCRALHAIDRTCIVTVMPRTGGAHALWRGRLATWVYDYSALAAAADRIRIMAYDEHAPEGAPGPVAPLGWVEQVIAYARAHMPAAKAELGLAAYGYAWGPGGGTTFTAAQASGLATAHGVRPVWSPAAAEAEFSYGHGRHRTIAWFEDSRADLVRARLALAAGFAGVALWAAGYETPSLWSGAASLH